MSFWPIGPLGKRAGLIFIRRSFGDDQVYKLAVREYFGHLVAKRFNLEWYIEGGRSRTGKLRPPRYGLLHYLVRALEDGRAEDVTLVPVSITYEQLQEVGAMAAEQGGGAKSAEGLGWLAGYAARAAAQRRAPRACASACRCRCARRSRTPARAARSSRRSRSGSASASTAPRRSRPRSLVTFALLERARPRAHARAGARR